MLAAGVDAPGGVTGVGAGYGPGSVAQAARVPTMSAGNAHRCPRPALLNQPLTRSMTLLLLEALGALVLLVFIVWWTMFSGRKNGELPDSAKGDEQDKKDTGAKD